MDKPPVKNPKQHVWYYIKKSWLNEETIGPISETDFVRQFFDNKLSLDTLVSSPTRTNGQWHKATQIASFGQAQARGIAEREELKRQEAEVKRMEREEYAREKERQRLEREHQQLKKQKEDEQEKLALTDGAFIGKDGWGEISMSHVQTARESFLDNSEKLLAMVKGRAKESSNRKDGFFSSFDTESNKGGSILNHYLIVTDRRVIIWARGAFKSSTDSIDYSDLNNVEQQNSMFWGAIVFNVHGNRENFAEMNKDETAVVADIVNQQKRHMDGAHLGDAPPPGLDPAAQLEKLGGLLEKGLITRTEFDEKKRKLLDQL